MNRAQLRFSSSSEAATQGFAAALAAQCAPGDCLLLRGELGAGKTAFARGFIRALCGKECEVTSPTFTLAQSYPLPAGGTLWHFDLYRLKSAHELAELGLDEALADGMTLIEWPEIAQAQLPHDALDVQITHSAGEARDFALSGDAARWQTRLGAL